MMETFLLEKTLGIQPFFCQSDLLPYSYEFEMGNGLQTN
jgi:hypothetical protein